jgi:hypothetical protein
VSSFVFPTLRVHYSSRFLEKEKENWEIEKDACIQGISAELEQEKKIKRRLEVALKQQTAPSQVLPKDVPSAASIAKSRTSVCHPLPAETQSGMSHSLKEIRSMESFKAFSHVVQKEVGELKEMQLRSQVGFVVSFLDLASCGLLQQEMKEMVTSLSRITYKNPTAKPNHTTLDSAMSNLVLHRIDDPAQVNHPGRQSNYEEHFPSFQLRQSQSEHHHSYGAEEPVVCVAKPASTLDESGDPSPLHASSRPQLESKGRSSAIRNQSVADCEDQHCRKRMGNKSQFDGAYRPRTRSCSGSGGSPGPMVAVVPRCKLELKRISRNRGNPKKLKVRLPFLPYPIGN